MSAEVINLSCYKFAPLEGLEELQASLQEVAMDQGLKGTILLAPEGINFFLAGTRAQLAAIRDSGGMVGLNYATSFLRRDGRQSPEMGWEDVLAHMDHLLSILGEDHVGLGSDFDGATVPQGIGDVVGQQALLEAFRAHGYGEALLRKIAHKNWFRVLERTWGA